MISKTLSGTIQGVDVCTVEIEVNYSEHESPQPHFNVIGLADAAVRESRDRVRSALMMNGFRMPLGNLTVNLAPAALRKSGALYDLPIALCLCAPNAGIDPEYFSGTMIIGELGLNGEVRAVHGALPLAVHARQLGVRRVVVPKANAREAAAVDGVDVHGVSTLRDAVNFFRRPGSVPPTRVDVAELFRQGAAGVPDFIDVKGQDSAKRALVIAAAGNHNILMIGQPGVGKSLIASRIPGIMPPLSLPEALEVTRLYSISGMLPAESALVTVRPFRAPHHTVSDAGLLGGGTGLPKPGEITLAHRGVLFLDELPEFRRNTLEALRQPLENGSVAIARASGAFVFPSRFMLVAAMNPCPCGYYGSPDHRCRCPLGQVLAYRARISGPLLDRIDLHIEVPPLSREVLTAKRNGVASRQMRDAVMVARQRQDFRFRGTGILDNSSIAGTAMDKFCALDRQSMLFMEQALRAKHLSARSYDRILRVARTIADLADRENITDADLCEACQYRCLEQNRTQ